MGPLALMIWWAGGAAAWPWDCGALMAPRSSQSGPKGPLGGALGGLENVEKHMDVERFVVWKQVKLAPSNTTNKPKNKRAFVCLWPIGAPQQEPQEAPKWGPRASLEEPLGVQKTSKNKWILNDSWFGSK